MEAIVPEAVILAAAVIEAIVKSFIELALLFEGVAEVIVTIKLVVLL